MKKEIIKIIEIIEDRFKLRLYSICYKNEIIFTARKMDIENQKPYFLKKFLENYFNLTYDYIRLYEYYGGTNIVIHNLKPNIYMDKVYNKLSFDRREYEKRLGKTSTHVPNKK